MRTREFLWWQERTVEGNGEGGGRTMGVGGYRKWTGVRRGRDGGEKENSGRTDKGRKRRWDKRRTKEG